MQIGGCCAKESRLRSLLHEEKLQSAGSLLRTLASGAGAPRQPVTSDLLSAGPTNHVASQNLCPPSSGRHVEAIRPQVPRSIWPANKPHRPDRVHVLVSSAPHSP